MTLREEVLFQYQKQLEPYKKSPQSMSRQEKEEWKRILLRADMDYLSLFQFGEGKRLMLLWVSPSFHTGVLYQIYETPDGEIWLYWKDSTSFYKGCQKAESMTISEIQNSIELQTLLNLYFPFEKRKVPEEQAQIIRKLYHCRLDENAKEISGCDGTNFYLRIYDETLQDYKGWTLMPKEWKLFAELTQIAAEVSEMGGLYTANTVFHN